MYPYAQVEKVLADFFDIAPERHTAFRGRLRNLQKLGLTPEMPGSGKRVKYSINDVCDLALAMSLAEFGADPHEIVKDVPSGTFKKHGGEMRKVERPACVYVPYLFSGAGSEIYFKSHKEAVQFIKHRPRAAIIDIDYVLCFLDNALAEVKITSPFDKGG